MRVTYVVVLVLILSGSIMAKDSAKIEAVLTSEGKLIHGAFFLVHDANNFYPQNVSSNREAISDNDGRVTLNVSGGCYDVFVSATFYTPHSERICIDEGKSTRLKIRLKRTDKVRMTME